MRRVLIILGLLFLALPGWAEDYIRYHPPMGGTISVPLLGAAANNCSSVPFSFVNDENTGLCSSAADTVGLIAGGTTRLSTTTTAVTSTVPITAPRLVIGDQATPYNSCFGFESCGSLTTGYANIAIGYRAGKGLTEGFGNVLIGYRPGLSMNSTGGINSTNNTAIGYNVMPSATGEYNTVVGSQALTGALTAADNTAIGAETLLTCQYCDYVTAVGFQAMRQSIGFSAGHETDATGYNTAIGYRAGYGNTSYGSEMNTFVGAKAGYANTTGNGNVLIGWQAGDSLTTGSGNIVIGNDVDGSSATVSDELNIGGLIKSSDMSQGWVTFPTASYSLTADSVVQVGQVVMPDAGTDGRFDVNATNSTLGIGVLAANGASAQGTEYAVVYGGKTYVVPQEDAAVTRGHYLIVSATAGCVNDSATVTTDGLNIGLSLYSEPVSHVIVIDGCGGGGCINTTTGAITLDTDVAALGWAAGQPVVYWDSGGTAPTGLTTGNVYFLKTVSTTTVTISATYGGAAVVPSNQGNDSTQYLQRLPQAVIAIH